MTARQLLQLATPRALMLAYLSERGISEAQADAAGFAPLSAAETMTRAGSTTAWGRCSIAIPYRDLDGNLTGHARLRFLGEPVGFRPSKEHKKPQRFTQEPDTGTPAYVPPGFARSIALDPSIDLYMTEGEVKALAATLQGIPTIAIGGVTTWHVEGDPTTLVAGLDAIVLQGRSVGVVFDSDAISNPNVQRAEAALCAELGRRGAFPRIIRLPPTADGKKQGLDDFIVAEGPEAFRRLAATVDRLPDALDTGAALLDTEYPPVEFAIAPYLPKGELIELHGAHGIGKSTVAQCAAMSVATGEPWGGAPVAKPGRAVFISLEDKSATLARRVRAWLRGGPKYGDRPDEPSTARRMSAIRERFASLGREKAASLVLTDSAFGQVHVRTAVVDRLVKLCAGADLVVLETASRLHPAGEDNESLSIFASALEEVATRTGAAVVLVRHVSKEQAKTGAADSYGGRGGGALADAARSVLAAVREKPDDPIRLVHAKSTHTARGDDLMWRCERDPEGEAFFKALGASEREAVGDERVRLKVLAAGEEGITVRELQRALPKKSQRSAAELEAVLGRLAGTGSVRKVEDPSASGRKVTRWVGAATRVGDVS